MALIVEWRAPIMLHRFRKLIYLGAAVGAGLALAAVVTLVMVVRLANTPMSESEANYVVAKGMGYWGLAGDLEEKGMVSSARLLRLYLWWRPPTQSLKTGEYRIEAGMLPGEFIERVQRGDSIFHSFVIIPGMTTTDILDGLRGHEALVQELPADVGVEDVMEYVADDGYMSYHGEGMFYADTYHFHRGTSDVYVLREAHRLLRRELEGQCAELPPQLGSAYEALSLASIVEKESGSMAEHQAIAAVFLNRLDRKMRLEADPTIIYGLGDSYDGDIKRVHLRTPTAYNTYTIPGLPPTPIANVWKKSLQAVCQPIEHNYLFFVADGEGGHTFNVDYESHLKAVRAYVRLLKERQ